MNIGHIPGFYWDADKQKYFKIQPGHKLADNDSKYSVSSVKKENRAHKRVKKEAQQLHKRLAARPLLAAALKFDSLSGSSLNRECGRRSATRAGIDDSACVFAAHLELSVVHPAAPREHVPVAVYTVHGASSTLVQTAKFLARAQWDHLTMDADLELDTAHLQTLRGHWCATYARQGDFSRLNCISTAIYGGATWLLPSLAYQYDNLQSRWLDDAPSALAGSVPTNKIPTPNSIIDVRPRHPNRVAIATLSELLCLNIGASLIDVLKVKRTATCVDWLSDNTMIAGQGKGVRLWDVRSQGSRTRIHHQKRVTGATAVHDSNETQILVSDNHELRVYDLRMTSKDRDRYPVGFHGVHEGHRAFVDIGPAGLVAAYRDDAMQILSLRQGRKVASYELPRRPRALPTQLLWQEDARGSPYVHMCVDGRLLRWSYHGGQDSW